MFSEENGRDPNLVHELGEFSWVIYRRIRGFFACVAGAHIVLELQAVLVMLSPQMREEEADDGFLEMKLLLPQNFTKL